MRKLFSNIEILDHIETLPEKGRWLPQDVWILKKNLIEILIFYLPD